MTRRRLSKGRWYVSYAWADENTPTLEQKVEALCSEAKARGIEVFRDKTALILGDLISDFMAEIGEGDRIFVFLSNKYLQSPFCMFEMYEMWRNSRQNKREFLRRVRFFSVDGAKISKPNDWLECTKFWIKERDSLGQAIDEIGWRVAGEETLRRYWLMQKFVGELSNVLSLFADVVSPRGIYDFSDLELVRYAFEEAQKVDQTLKGRLDREPPQGII